MTKLEELITYIEHKHVYIQTHNFPDPDAIASAFGLQKLLSKKGINATLCFSGKIDRHSTQMMLTFFSIDFTNIDDIESLTEDDEVILVDSQKGNSNIRDMIGNEIICIDHHPASDESIDPSLYRFTDIRPEVGACASIIASYFYENNVHMDSITATVLCYGIKMDTSGLSRGVSQLDLDMFYKLYQRCNPGYIASLEHSVLKLDDLKAYAAAINSINVVGDVSFANAGHNCPEALIASVSDFMIQLQEVEFSVVYSFKKDGVKLSIRSVDRGYNAGVITEKALTKIGSGGGHPQMAGGFIAYSRLDMDEYVDEEKVAEIIKKTFLKVLNK